MRNRYVIAALAGALLLAGCGGSATSSPGVPALSQAAGQGAQGRARAGARARVHRARPRQPTSLLSGSARAAALHAAAQCIRQHGIPSYADPVLTASGQVYSDSRSIQDASQPVANAVYHACSALAARAGLNPSCEPPAPPQLVEAGVRSAECLRAHGLPNVHGPDRPDALHARPRVRLYGQRDTGRGQAGPRLPGGRARVPRAAGRRDPRVDAGEPEQ